jgi:4-amino-4-deoxy-L-arabinose transferase-like glycosyltransferase
LFAIDLGMINPKEPDWDNLSVGKAIPPDDRPAFFGPRRISAIGGTFQVFITALVHPIAGILMALDTYHTKYSAQVYLEGVPGLMAVLAVFLFEFAVPEKNADLKWKLLIPSAIALGLAGAGKYLYGFVGFVLLAFLIRKSRSVRSALLYSGVAVCAFLVADPFLWPNPPARLWDSLTFHWRFAHSEHVVSAGLPWYAPFYYLLHAEPTKWHHDVFFTGLADILILPLSLFGIRRAIQERPIWIAWAAFGLVFLVLWPTKWPQYILFVLPPLAVCAALGVEQIVNFIWKKLRKPDNKLCSI